MTRLTPSSEAQKRIEQLFNQLIPLAIEHSSISYPSRSECSVRLINNSSVPLKLIVKTELRFLANLVFGNPDSPQTTQKRDRHKDRIRHDLRLLEKIGLLEDHRTRTQGSSLWHFSLKLWSTDPEQNLKTFRQEWQRYKTQRNGQSNSKPTRPKSPVPPHTCTGHRDWGNAPDLPNFHGRTQELTTLQQWIIDEHCRLVAVVGMAGSGKTQLSVKLGKGGIGKTDLSLKLAKGIQHQFDYVIWRSLLNAPKFADLLSDLSKSLSDQQDVSLPKATEAQISSLLSYLQQHRCLIVLDNMESIFQSGTQSEHYRPGYEAYGELLRHVAEVPHQSCLLLTSREKPPGLFRFIGHKKPVRFFNLSGLTEADGQAIFDDIGEFVGSSEAWRALVTLYNGNPLALETAAHHIKDLYGGNLTHFLKDDKPLFSDIRNLLNWHLERLSDAEMEVLYWLAINREAITITELREDLVSAKAKANVTEMVRSLQRRLPIETTNDGLTLQPMLMEHITERLIAQICQEISSGNICAFNRYSLLKATAKDYIRESQKRVILQPMQDQLLDNLGDRQQLQMRLDNILDRLQSSSTRNGYAAGNIINLLCYLQIDLTGYDFSGLVIRQAYLQKTPLRNANLSGATLIDSIFTSKCAHAYSVAYSPDGTVLATGDTRGDVQLWDPVSGKLLNTLTEHANWICALAFSSDGQQLASGGMGHVIKLWDPCNGKCLKTLSGHNTGSFSVQFSPDGKHIASSGLDGKARLWSTTTGKCLKVFTGHHHALYGVAFHPTAPILATSSQDATVKLWDIKTASCLKTLQGHQDGVRSVAFSPCGQYLVSGGVDQTLRLWSVEAGEDFAVLQGHTGEVYCVVFSSDGRTLASSSDDATVRLWDVETGQCKNSFPHPTPLIMSVAYSPDGRTVASANDIQGSRVWDTKTGRCLRSLAGNTEAVRGLAFVQQQLENQPNKVANNQDTLSQHQPRLLSIGYVDTIHVWDVETGRKYDLKESAKTFHSVAVSPDHQLLATGSRDQTMSLWNAQTLQYLGLFDGHTDGIWDVGFNFDNTLLASGSFDRTIKIWSPQTGKCVRTLSGHIAGIWSIAWHPKRNILFSGSLDKTIRVWDVSMGKCMATFSGHESGVRSVAISPDGSLLASGSLEGTIKLWDIASGQCLDTLIGHTNFVWYVAFHPHGQTIASGGFDQTIRIWDVQSRQCIHILQEDMGNVEVLAFSPDGTLLASGGDDGITRLWDSQTGKLHKTLRVAQPYEGTKITGIKGLTDTQKASLRTLGAV